MQLKAAVAFTAGKQQSNKMLQSLVTIKKLGTAKSQIPNFQYRDMCALAMVVVRPYSWAQQGAKSGWCGRVSQAMRAWVSSASLCLIIHPPTHHRLYTGLITGKHFASEAQAYTCRLSGHTCPDQNNNNHSQSWAWLSDSFVGIKCCLLDVGDVPLATVDVTNG